MFYSETLLSKTGPLARVWLSANLERKLSKTHILQSNIESSVGAIVGQDQAPMALRLSGQLLLGVVRIYSRKARYLLEDCNEALMKIKMAFRPGNVDLPAGATSHTTAQLTLPDVITELDLLIPDPTLDLGDFGDLGMDFGDSHMGRKDLMLESSQLLTDSLDVGRGMSVQRDEEGLAMEEDDLGLDIGDDEAPARPLRATTVAREFNFDLPDDLDDASDGVEIGRRAPSVQSDFFSDRLEDIEMGDAPAAKVPEPLAGLEDDDLGIDLGLDDDTGMGYAGDLGLPEGDTTIREPSPAREGTADAGPDGSLPPPEPMRDESPLSDIESEPARPRHGDMLDVTFDDEALQVVSDDEEAGERHAGRKKKVLVDSVTELRGKQIKAQQEDRSNIIKEPTFLPRDPGLLALMSLQANGRLAQTVFYPKNLAPELANLLNPDFIKRISDMKRKRGKEAGEGQSPAKQPRLELESEHEGSPLPELMAHHEEDDDDHGGSIIDLADIPAGADESEIQLPNIGGSISPAPDIIPRDPSVQRSPSEDLPAAPVSRETRHAVHVLREQFSGSKPKASVKFQELLPPRSSTRGDATKLFFECLVLATKDAVSLKQDQGFGKIDIGSKKSLWGAWAEEKDEQQIAEEEEKRAELEAEKLGRAMGGVGAVQATPRTLRVGRRREEGVAAA